METAMRRIQVAMESVIREMSDRTGGIFEEISRLTTNDDLVQNVERMKNDEDKIRILQPHFNWKPSTSNRNNFQKSSAKSKKYEEEAKSFLNNFEGDKAITAAHMITAFAADAHDLVWGHYMRSETRMFLGQGEFTFTLLMLEELESALKILNQNPHSELKQMVMRRYSTLKGFSKTEFGINQLARIEEKKKKYMKFTKSLVSLKSPNKKAPALEDFVKIRYNSSRGRHVVLTKDVPVGTTLLVEKPFLSGLVNILQFEKMRYCHHCHKQHFKPSPCPNCVFVLFCSEKCQKEAQSYHKYECPCFPDLHDLFSWNNDTAQALWLIAFKLVCSLGPTELYRQFQKEKGSKKSASPSDVDAASDGSKLIKGFDPLTGIFDPASFLTARHIQRLNLPSSFQSIVVALALTKVIETRTDFFKLDRLMNLNPQMKLQFKNYVTQVLFRQFDSNLFWFTDESGSYQAAISPTVALFSHSCDPNVIVCKIRRGDGLRIAKVAARDLKAGEELFVNYVEPFYTMNKNEREKTLRQGHDFKCDCTACSNDWPVMTEELEGFVNVNPVFCCVNQSCSKSKSTSKDVEKVPLVLQKGGKKLKCPVCNSVYEEEKLFRQFVMHLNSLEKALNLLKEDDELKAVKGLLTASTFFQANFQSPSVHQIKCQEILDKVLSLSSSHYDLVD